MDAAELIARAEITDAITRYCRGVDRGDVDLIRSAYHADATEDHGTFVGLSHDFAPHIVAKMAKAATTGQHSITNMTFDITGNTARVETYYLALQPYVDEAGESDVAIMAGRYLDEFSQRDGAWLISAREVIIDWTHAHLPDTPWFGASAFRSGARGAADPSAAFFAGVTA